MITLMHARSMWLQELSVLRLLLACLTLGSLLAFSSGCRDSDAHDGNDASGLLFYEFPERTRCFPKYMLQFGDPIFFWDDFTEYHAAHWGDNSNGSIHIADGDLDLEPKKQIWLLYRLGYGTAEFRDLSWGATPGPEQGKTIGFGDPAEGEFVGFRLDQVTGQLIAEVRHLGGIAREIIPWDVEYDQPARYIVQWNHKNAVFHVLTPIRGAKIAEIGGTAVPDIRLEIIVWNQGGPGNIRVGTIKYDKSP